MKQEVIMLKKLLPLAALVLLSLALLAGCAQPMAVIIGSIFIESTDFSAQGGMVYHVLLYETGTIVDTNAVGSADAVTPVASADGTFPGTTSNVYDTINYAINDVPAGNYFALAWIDRVADGTYVPTDDYIGFYDANAMGGTIWTQPSSPNVIVPETGLLDIDIWCSYNVP